MLIYNLKATPQVIGTAAVSFKEVETMRFLFILVLSIALFFPSASLWAQHGGMGGGMHGGRGGAYEGMHSDGRYGGPSDDMGRQESMRRNYERETERLRNEMNATREERRSEPRFSRIFS